MNRRIYVLDTTLRDGEQVPGAKLNVAQKLEVAYQLKKLRVDYIEAGFPSSSPGDLRAVQEVSRRCGDDDVVITALARAVRSDIDAVWEGVRFARRPMIHIVLGTSDIHVEKKFRRSRDEVLQMGIEAVRYAKTLSEEVQYSTEDASRSDFEYLWKTIESVVCAGATIVNVPDTVGFAVPEEFGSMIFRLKERLVDLNPKVLLSVHCHNDTGLATANTLIAVKNGADKVECTVNGIGERAGNAALEEVVMAMKVRSEYYGAFTNVETKEIKNTSTLVEQTMGLDVQVNKAITGANAFAHSSGIHQDGLLKSKDSYEIIDPQDVGIRTLEFRLTARSGRHAFRSALERLRLAPEDESETEELFQKFLALADQKKEVSDAEILFLVNEFRSERRMAETNVLTEIRSRLYRLEFFEVISNGVEQIAEVSLLRDGKRSTARANGDGPIDALYAALNRSTGVDAVLKNYRIQSVGSGKDTLGKIQLNLEVEGRTHTTVAADTNILKASVCAYLQILNQIEIDRVTVSPEVDVENSQLR